MKARFIRFLRDRFGLPILRPRLVLDRFGLIVAHVLGRGAIVGINLRIDPTSGRSPVRRGWLLLILAPLLFYVEQSRMFHIAIILAVLCPVWAYALAPTIEAVMENRAYSLGLPIAILGALAANAAPSLVTILIGLWALQTFRRNGIWRNRMGFWNQALRENPQDLRAEINRASVLSTIGRNDEAIAVYETLLESGDRHPRLALAAANLAGLYRERRDFDNAIRVLNHGFDRWPTAKLIRLERGLLLMTFAEWEAAIAELDLVIAMDPAMIVALRNRAICWGQLGNAKLAQRDGDLACEQDGIRAVVRLPIDMAPLGARTPFEQELA